MTYDEIYEKQVRISRQVRISVTFVVCTCFYSKISVPLLCSHEHKHAKQVCTSRHHTIIAEPVHLMPGTAHPQFGALVFAGASHSKVAEL